MLQSLSSWHLHADIRAAVDAPADDESDEHDIHRNDVATSAPVAAHGYYSAFRTNAGRAEPLAWFRVAGG